MYLSLRFLRAPQYSMILDNKFELHVNLCSSDKNNRYNIAALVSPYKDSPDTITRVLKDNV